VYRAECHPDEVVGFMFHEGDIVCLRAKIVVDAGSDVQCLIEGPGQRQTFWAPRSTIAKLERS